MSNSLKSNLVLHISSSRCSLYVDVDSRYLRKLFGEVLVTKFFLSIFHWHFKMFYFFYLAQQPTVGQRLLNHEVSRSHTTTHHSQYDSSGRVISPSQRSLPDITQHSQQTEIHAPGGIRTHNLSRRSAADLRLRPRDHCDRQNALYCHY